MGDSVVTTPPPAAPAAQRADILRWVCLVLVIFGWWLSAELNWQSLGQAGGTMLVQALCAGDSAGGSCRSVIASEWGSVAIFQSASAPRMPTAAFGMGYFAAIALWLIFIGLPRRGRWGWHVPLLIFLLVGAVTSVCLLAAMGIALKRWCLACTLVHTLNLALLILVILGFVFRRRAGEESHRPTTSAAVSAMLASVMILMLHLSIIFTLVFGRSVGPLQEAYNKIIRDPAFAKWQFERQEAVEFPDDDTVASDGPADAPVTIVFFSDFQCPACRKAHTALKDALAERPERFRVFYRHFPLSTACNPGVQFTRHPAACGAALAAEAAFVAGGPAAGKSMRDRLYERQDETRPAAYSRWAEEFGVDTHKYAEAVSAPQTAERIARDAALGQKVGVTATPVLFVNGRRFDYWVNDAAWRDALGLPVKSSASSPVR